ESLRKLCQTIDLVLSPNRPNRLAPGAFDGFPTGSCVEAGLQEAAIFCTDVLKMNTLLRDGTDVVIVEPALEDILRKLVPRIREPRALAQMGINARAALVKAYGAEAQLGPRVRVIRDLIG